MNPHPRRPFTQTKTIKADVFQDAAQGGEVSYAFYRGIKHCAALTFCVSEGAASFHRDEIKECLAEAAKALGYRLEPIVHDPWDGRASVKADSEGFTS